MNKVNMIVPTFAVVIGLSLVGVILYQQLEISRLHGRNEELAVSNLQKGEENADLRNSYNQLNSTYFQLLSSLETITSLLNSSDSELSSLKQDYLNLLESYHSLSDSYDNLSANWSSKVDSLKESIAQLSEELGLGYEGIFILNYTYIYTYDYPIHRYFGEFVLYNALESANVTVKVYSPQSYRTFTYSMPAYSKQTYVEHWDTGMEMGKDFSLIRIENVEREYINNLNQQTSES